MGPDFSANGYSFDLDTDEFSLESILREYKNYDPNAPAPRPRAEFEARPVTAELIDEPDAPEEPLGVLEQALAATEPEPEPEPKPEAEPADPFSAYAEDYPPEAPEAAPEAKGRGKLLRGTWRETLGLPEEKPDDDTPEDDVREYHPGEFHARRPRRRQSRSDSGVRKRLKGIRDWVDRVTAEYEDDLPEDEFDPEQPDEIIRPDPPQPTDEPDEPTMVFHAVSEADEYAPRSSEEYADEADDQPDLPPRLDFREAVLQPIYTRIAAVAFRIRESRERVREAAEAEEPLGPEPTPERAAKYYGARIRPLMLRGRISAVVTLILLYISLGLPVFGLLRSSPTVLAITCLILLMTAMLAGLDVLATGILALVRRRPGIETMVALSAIFSMIDALVCAIIGEMPFGLPFCGVSALAITVSLYAARFSCQGLRKTFRVLQKAEEPITVFSDPAIAKEGLTLIKSSRGTEGFIHRAEESSPGEALYTILSPYMIVLGLVLSLLAAILNGALDSIAHVLAAVFAAFVPLAALLSFALPYRTVAQRLFSRGIAVAGWSGVSDVGRSAHMVVTDDDVYPPGTIRIGEIRVLGGVYPQKVISSAASVVIASGSCLAPVFAQLLEKHHGRLIPVDQFNCSKTGGLTATVDGEEIMVGAADFVNLRGIRLSERMMEGNQLFIVVNGQLVGIVELTYRPVRSVQNALLELARSRQDASFAVRDANITPAMLHDKFKIPNTNGFHFPSYAKRYAMSAAEPSEETHVAGVMARRGLGSYVRLASMSKRLFSSVRWLVGLSCAAALIAVTAMFLLLAMGAFDAATAANLILFQLLFLIPVFAFDLGLRR